MAESVMPYPLNFLLIVDTFETVITWACLFELENRLLPGLNCLTTPELVTPEPADITRWSINGF